jgi:hypothetical protein
MYKDKSRDLRRSILPSSSRKGARNSKRYARKRSRSNIRQALAHYDFENEFGDYNELDDFVRETRAAVFLRRDFDKVAPIISWAEDLRKKYPNAEPDEMYTRVRAVLGHGYMADHAITHIEFSVEGFRLNEEAWSWWHWTTPTAAEEKEALYKELVEKTKDLWLCGRKAELKKLAWEHKTKIETKDSTLSTQVRFVPDYSAGFRNAEGTRWKEVVDNIYVRYIASYGDIESAVHVWVYPYKNRKE